MGEFATTVQNYLREELSNQWPTLNWETEYQIARTPVDVGGQDSKKLVLLELEWRRADPADNAAKLFRHLDTGSIEADTIEVFHVFTDYYDLKSGGISSKRKNAEFVGQVAADSFEQLSYHPLEFEIDPPKRGEEWPTDWEMPADTVIRSIVDRFGGNL